MNALEITAPTVGPGTHPLAYFQRIYVINLAERADRRREMDAQLRRVGLALGAGNVQLFSAVRPDHPAGFPNVGARGCFLSHLGVLRDAAAHDYERILILEDDVNFSTDFSERIRAVTEALSWRNWSVFYGGFRLDDGDLSGHAYGLAAVAHDQGVQTTHFLGLARPAIGGLAVFLEQMLARPPGSEEGGPMHVDGAYSWYRRANPADLTFAAVPQLGYQRSSRTDVHALHWFDRLPGVRGIVETLRHARNLMRSGA